jgi:hypothetical protein
MAEVEILVLEHLQHIGAGVDDLRMDMREVKNRLGILEAQYASQSGRVDRIGEKIERVERRLDLADA